MGGKHSRDKGKRGELEVVNAFKRFGFEARRGYQARDGAETPDVILDGGDDLWVEVKRGKRPSPYGALDQARKACGSREPIVVTRRDGDKWYAFIELETLLPLWRNALTLHDMHDEIEGQEQTAEDTLAYIFSKEESGGELN